MNQQTKLATENIDGLNNNGQHFYSFVKQRPETDFFLLQETRKSIAETYKSTSVHKGYSAVAVQNTGNTSRSGCVTMYKSKHKPINILTKLPGSTKPGNDGRFIGIEFKDFWLINLYNLHAGTYHERIPDKIKWFDRLLNTLNNFDKKKPVIAAGDYNIASPYINANLQQRYNAGFLPDEQDMLAKLSLNFTDALKYKYPTLQKMLQYLNTKGASQNFLAKAFRIDYVFVSNRIAKNIVSADVLINPNVTYTDSHIPIEVVIQF